jgi:hypothetical protein
VATLRARDALERLEVGWNKNFYATGAALHHLEWFAFCRFRGAHGRKINIVEHENKGVVVS